MDAIDVFGFLRNIPRDDPRNALMEVVIETPDGTFKIGHMELKDKKIRIYILESDDDKD